MLFFLLQHHLVTSGSLTHDPPEMRTNELEQQQQKKKKNSTHHLPFVLNFWFNFLATNSKEKGEKKHQERQLNKSRVRETERDALQLQMV